jgi:hypothetical protein
MTEDEWLTCADPTPMLAFLVDKGSERKFRLFSVACDVAAGLGMHVSAFERHADGIATKEDERLLGNDWSPAWQSACLSLNPTAHKHESDLLRDIVGNPFRAVAAGASWLTSTVVALADGIYQERAFDRMPILADALQDAGCDNEDILNHCQQPGEHVRGCWVVDLLMGKS